jgi:ribosomal protein S17
MAFTEAIKDELKKRAHVEVTVAGVGDKVRIPSTPPKLIIQ